MKYNNDNTNENLKQLTPETLIVGIDIAKITHVARAVDYRGIELDKEIAFNSNIKGFRLLIAWIHELQLKHKKTEVIVGMEPTGPYGHTLAHFLDSGNIRTVLVFGKNVKSLRELDDNTPSKNDRKDALTIARLIKDGRFRKLRKFDEPIMALKEAMMHNRQLTSDLTRVKCRIDNWICQYFPEFSIVFKDWEKKTAFSTLSNFPMPAEINKLTSKQIVTVWRKDGVIKGVGLKKAIELKRYAMVTTGLSSASEFAGNHIRNMIDQYNLLCEQQDELWMAIDALLKDIPLYNTVIQIPHISKKAVCGIVAELGDVSDFSHPKQLVRLSGLSLAECTSGKKRGLITITKRGRPHLRHWLYIAVLNIIKDKEPTFWSLHQYYTKREKNPLKPMQSIIALCCKLLRVIFGMATKGCAYDPTLITAGIPSLKAA